ncbi:MAG: hypothetical protein AAB470_01875 [Patescibacteria group bacterium]
MKSQNIPRSDLESLEEFMTKIELARKEGGVDLSTTEDLSIAVMNLISLEEHFFFTGVKTKKEEYFDTAQEVRNLRKELLAQLMPNHEGETWCASKHLLAVTMRLIEVGNKLQSENKKKLARQTFEKAYKTYTIFWALKLKLIGVKKVTEEVDIQKATGNSMGVSSVNKQSDSLEEIMKKLADCCKE